jgi:hypothetical protein
MARPMTIKCRVGYKEVEFEVTDGDSGYDRRVEYRLSWYDSDAHEWIRMDTNDAEEMKNLAETILAALKLSGV